MAQFYYRIIPDTFPKYKINGNSLRQNTNNFISESEERTHKNRKLVLC